MIKFGLRIGGFFEALGALSRQAESSVCYDRVMLGPQWAG